MESLIIATGRALRSIFAPGMLKIFLVSVMLTLLLLALFISGASSFFVWLGHAYSWGWLSVIGSIGSGLLGWMLFPGIMPIIVNFFDTRITQIIEREDYPASEALQNPPFWPEFWHDLRFSLFTLLANLIVLPFYLFMHVFGPIVFFWLNGYLLGREFFEMAARRHIPLEEAKALRKRHSRIVLIAGVLLAIMATIPIINLFAPFWGIAVMVHLYHRVAATPQSQILPPA
jgi:CysZ protein